MGCSCQHLLKKQYPHLSELQSTVLKETGKWDIMASDGIQILNQTNTHWLCITAIECAQRELSIYESKFTKRKVHPEISQQIVSFICTQAPHITLRVMRCQASKEQVIVGFIMQFPQLHHLLMAFVYLHLSVGIRRR